MMPSWPRHLSLKPPSPHEEISTAKPLPSTLLRPYSGEQAQLGLDRSLLPIEKCLLLWIGNRLLAPMRPWLKAEGFG
jgi:hypothetical protein